MHIHILGICGTFMGGLAVIAKQAGHEVSGCDANVYPPMSTQLEAQGISLTEGWDPDQVNVAPRRTSGGRGSPASKSSGRRGPASTAAGTLTRSMWHPICS